MDPRAPADDEERDATSLKRDYCYDSFPPVHEECTRENGHAGDHVAVVGGLVVARWSEADWHLAAQDDASDYALDQLVADGAVEIAEYLNMRRWAAMCWRDDDGRPYGRPMDG